MERLQKLIKNYGDFSFWDVVKENNAFFALLIIYIVILIVVFFAAYRTRKSGVVATFVSLILIIFMLISLSAEFNAIKNDMLKQSFKEIIETAKEEDIKSDELQITDELIVYGDYVCRHGIDKAHHVYENNDGYYIWVD